MIGIQSVIIPRRLRNESYETFYILFTFYFIFNFFKVSRTRHESCKLFQFPSTIGFTRMM